MSGAANCQHPKFSAISRAAIECPLTSWPIYKLRGWYILLLAARSLSIPSLLSLHINIASGQSEELVYCIKGYRFTKGYLCMHACMNGRQRNHFSSAQPSCFYSKMCSPLSLSHTHTHTHTHLMSQVKIMKS